ncbi:RECEPTOR-LIKE PROTEIN KINASE HSL1 [Salix viminalis]|uniref:non-specific serine/threonine protein kinase n=1 Tax=Salix viminalis TaxID=40686 RepID=A0A9Q0NX91_SALVM|nr:RECEPTOR-LIKE PROTEIN KINASE HSL1 [Salix viminalis]
MFFHLSLLFLSLLLPSTSLNQDGLFLQKVKLGLSDPSLALSSWNDRDDTPCKWDGVTCDKSTQRVTSLDLSSLGLMGPFPYFLCRLTNLTSVNLMNNFINSSLTSDIAACQSLEVLDLSENLLVGSLPEALPELRNLKTLNLASNNFSGGIPAKFGEFQKLEWISLAENLLTGNSSRSGLLAVVSRARFPRALGKLSRLTNLDLSLNRLTGSIPSSLTWLKSVEQIELYNNTLSGELPPGFSNFDPLELESLHLFENRLEGTLPENIARSPNLNDLKLFDNKLTGELPSQLGLNSPLKVVGCLIQRVLRCDTGELVCESLGRVRLRNNGFTGIVPEGFWGLPRVYLLELEDNSFTGKVSNRIASAYNLSVLKISKTIFTGNLPAEIGLLGKLIEFSASDNLFTGPIPGSLVKLSNLSTLVLVDNELSGGIPAGIQGWKSLNDLRLANNRLSGSIPDEIGSLPVLNYLDLSGNYFSGKIPIQLQDLKLNLLNLSNNMLSGALPPLYAIETYRSSFVGNPGLCGDLKDLCPHEGDSKKQSYLWILRSIFILAGIVFVVGVAWFYFKYQNLKKAKRVVTTASKWRSFHKIGFSEFEILDFLKEDNVIGSGGSGKVYKAVLSTGETVAVKKLSGESKKKDTSRSSNRDEFEAEVETLGNIRHKNIVRLCSKGGLLDWPTRYKIALDAAEGLSYLHHDCVPPIVHRDVKSNNILLDAEFGARVADFGVAKVVQGANKGIDQSMSVIAGSCGYIAPEYAYTLRVNEKSDIYSFGVVILELVTGRPPIDPEFGEKDLVKWVCTTLDQSGTEHVIDPKLDSRYRDEVSKVLDVGLRCTNSLPAGRPSMRRVVKMLQEAGTGSKPKANKSDGKLSRFYNEVVSDQASLV